MEGTTVESIFGDDEVKVTLTIKLGEPPSDVDSIVSSEQEMCWTEKDVYLKPGSNTKQRDFTKISADMFDANIIKAWRDAQRRDISAEDFYLLVSRTRDEGQPSTH
ncbi:hypothetical protein PF002_g16521 [Phytophthora fragariae]|uniref:Uncharacterized protein n=1 Tax=Phytophthora fragariae TaxID=53985 RepID=A0A6A3HXV4_9STRA|nr:hypothetical protein PF003_g14790 [Phytophthora fragariae]KAE8934050.1 hypothetical protein PF009_g15962 [Phytophthora fragariae]KAE8973892.1 hypothetical protein PF011_g25076 [Phytophthora fragariae]KAE9135861.1 hypothetical protein PF006_g14507 [Phytophthora fragariae]KAE9218364.1 hypothetical protein PF002_g16521 [Phytophthora fragariae]